MTQIFFMSLDHTWEKFCSYACQAIKPKWKPKPQLNIHITDTFGLSFKAQKN